MENIYLQYIIHSKSKLVSLKIRFFLICLIKAILLRQFPKDDFIFIFLVNFSMGA